MKKLSKLSTLIIFIFMAATLILPVKSELFYATADDLNTTQQSLAGTQTLQENSEVGERENTFPAADSVVQQPDSSSQPSLEVVDDLEITPGSPSQADPIPNSTTGENQTTDASQLGEDQTAPENTAQPEPVTEQNELPQEADEVPQIQATMQLADTKYFSLVCSDTEFNNYSPIVVRDNVANISDFSLSIVQQLNSLYAPYLEVSESQEIDAAWSEIELAAFLIPGDVLVSEDFSMVGIYIENDKVFSLNDQKFYLPSDYRFFNKEFQNKTIQTVW